MYKFHKPVQGNFNDFNQSCGMALNPDNELVKMRDLIPWRDFEPQYAEYFSKAKKGKGALSLQIVLGSLILQLRSGLSDIKFVKALAENPYWQYFIGLKSFSHKAPFGSTSLVYFRKRVTADIINSMNETLLEKLTEIRNNSGMKYDSAADESTTILDATCAPSYISFPTDTGILNESRKRLEKIIDELYEKSGLSEKPRTYRRTVDSEYRSFSKKKKNSSEEIKKMKNRLLNCLKRNFRHIESFVASGIEISEKQRNYYETVQKIYAQQKEMYDKGINRTENRIVSLDKPFLRPVVRGKKGTPVEFGAKFDVSLDENGWARMEKISFNPYNESEVLINALERYREREGKYPKRVLCDGIYRTRKNISFCKEHSIRISGPRLGRPQADKSKENKKIERQDLKDRIAIERFFSLAKRSNGMGVIKAKLAETTIMTIALSVLVTNLFSICYRYFFVIYFINCENFCSEPFTWIEFSDE